MKQLRTFFFLSPFLLANLRLHAVDTTIRGGRVELLNQGETILFTGGVQLVRGSDTLHADQMKTNKTREKVHAQGNVRLFRRVSPEETWKGFGESGFYDTKTGTGYLLEGKQKAHLIRNEILSSTITRRVDLFAARFDFSKEKSHAIATGSAYGKTTDPANGDVYEFWSDQADYYGTDRRVVLSGSRQPRLVQTAPDQISTLTGDVITYDINTQVLMSVGQAQAVFNDMGKKKK